MDCGACIKSRNHCLEDELNTLFEQIQTIAFPKRYIRAIGSELFTPDNIDYPIRELD